MPELTLPDASLHYEVSGTGPPLVMIAGFMSDGASWAPLAPLLEPHFTLIRPDNRTCGQTGPWDAPVSMDHWVNDILSLLDHLGHTRVHVLGHSLGGIIGWAMAAKTPERVARLMIMGSAPIYTPRNHELFRALIAIRRSNAPKDTWLRVLFPWLFQERSFHNAEAITAAVNQSLAYPFAQSADAMERQLDALLAIDATPLKTPPPVPCLSVLSKADSLVPFDDAMASMTGIEVMTLVEEGHSMHWDAPALIADTAKQFFEENNQS